MATGRTATLFSNICFVTLQSRFSLTIGGLVFLILALFSGAFLIMENRHTLSQKEDLQRSQTEHLAHACVQSRLNHDEVPLLKLFKEMQKSPGFVEAMCLDGKGRVTLHNTLSRMGEQPAGTSLPFEIRKSVMEADGKTLWAYDSPAKGGGVPGGARVVFDSAPIVAEVQKTLEGTLVRLGGAGAAIMLLVFVLSWATAKTLTGPIHRLATGTRELSQGNWDTRVGTDGPGELGVLARDFNFMSEKLGELDRLKDQFVHSVSHDLRNPLGAILASSRMLQNDNLSEESKTLIEVIETGVTRLSAMVNNILDVACLQERSLTFNLKPFALDPLLRELTRLYEPLAHETEKRIEILLPQDLPLVNADLDKVFRVFLNLLANAMKFTRGGDVIVFSAKRLATGWVECRVTDNGPGISHDRLGHIFSPFLSKTGASSENRYQQGSGLGLSLVKALVEGHGGQIHVESAPNKGASFIFTLPGVAP
jgi:signal transduction histidine kinase